MSNQKKTKVFITTARPLEEPQRILLKKLIAKKLGSNFETQEEVDKDSLGGIKIKIGSQEFDATIAGKLKKIPSQAPIVEVSTADGLTPNQKSKLQKTLAKTLGNGFTIKETIDQSLIAGLHLRINDKEYDGTIKNQFTKLRQQIKKSL